MDHIPQVAAPSLLMFFFNMFIEFPRGKWKGFFSTSDLPFAVLLSALTSRTSSQPLWERTGRLAKTVFVVSSLSPLYEDKNNVGKVHVVWCEDTVSGSRVREEIFWARNCHPSWLIKLMACDIDLCPREKRPEAKLQGVGWSMLGSLRSGVASLYLTHMRPEYGKQGYYVLNTY